MKESTTHQPILEVKNLNVALRGAGRLLRDVSLTVRPGEVRALVGESGAGKSMIGKAVLAETGKTPKLSTSGGTSDARFVKDHCPVVEFGLVGKTMHMVDEKVPTADIITLKAIYARVLRDYFA